MNPELVLVKYHQPESNRGLGKYRLDGLYDHPARWVYCVCWLRKNSIQLAGAEGFFPLDEDLKCRNFLGEFQAQVVERSLPQCRVMDADYYELDE